jgi:hypothetical protein
MAFWDFLTGSPEKHKRVSTLLKNQRPIQEQQALAAQQSGAGGAFGTSADYYRDLLSDNPQDYQALAAPEQRRFNEEIIPGLSEQFAGMGAGGLSSSGFRNAAVNAGTDLAERLGAIRAGLRQQGAAGLAGIGQSALGNYSQDVVSQQGTQGILAPALGAAATAFGGPAAGQLAQMGGQWLSNSLKGKSSPYGNANTTQQLDLGFRSGALR